MLAIETETTLLHPSLTGRKRRTWGGVYARCWASFAAYWKKRKGATVFGLSRL